MRAFFCKCKENLTIDDNTDLSLVVDFPFVAQSQEIAFIK
jgi:hypothetical protein